jgi:hypothetical protein
LSSLALMHIHRHFSVDLDKVMEKFVSAKTTKNRFWAILSKLCLTKSWNQCIAVIFMTLNCHKKPQRDFVFPFFKIFIIPFFFFALYFCFLHADVHATACWHIGSYAPDCWLTDSTVHRCNFVTIYLYILSNINYHNFINEINASVVTIYWAWLDLGRSGKSKDYSIFHRHL